MWWSLDLLTTWYMIDRECWLRDWYDMIAMKLVRGCCQTFTFPSCVAYLPLFAHKFVYNDLAAVWVHMHTALYT
jgi:hypothetical protein